MERLIDMEEVAFELDKTPAIRVCTDRATLMATVDDKTEWIKYHPFLDMWCVFKENHMMSLDEAEEVFID